MSAKKTRAIILATSAVVLLAIIGYAMGTYGAKWIQESEYQEKRDSKTNAVMERMNDSIHVGAVLPDAEFQDLTGKRVRLSGLVRSSTVIAYLRNPCGNCRRELWYLNEATAENQKQSFFVLISDSDPERLKELRDDFGLTSLILYDEGGIYRQRLGIFTFPFNIIVDDSLVIGDMIAGYIRSEEFAEIISGKSALRR